MGYTNFPSNVLGEAGFTDANDGGVGLNVGVIIKSAVPGNEIHGLRWRSPNGTADAGAYVYDNDGNILASSTAWTSLGNNWHQATFVTPVPMVENDGYVLGIARTGDRRYSYKASAFPVDDGDLYIETQMGRWSYVPDPFLDDATSNGSNSWYGVDAVIWSPEPSAAGALSATFTLSGATVPEEPGVATGALGAKFTLSGVTVRPLPLQFGASLTQVRDLAVADANGVLRPIQKLYYGDSLQLLWERQSAELAVGPLGATFTLSGQTVAPPPPGGMDGWFLTAANTGIAKHGLTDADLTAYSGSPSGGTLHITTDQYQKLIDLGSNQLTLGPDVKLTQCKIVGNRESGQGQIRFTNAGSGLIDCTVLSTYSGSGESMGVYTSVADGHLISGCYIQGFSIGVWSDGSGANPSIMEDTYIVTRTTGAAHKDGFTRRTGSNSYTIRRSRIDTAGTAVTGAFFIQPTWGPVSNVRVEDSYLTGAGYICTIQTSNNVQVVNNRFSPSGGYGPKVVEPYQSQGMPTNLTWSENYHYANDPGNDYRGAFIP